MNLRPCTVTQVTPLLIRFGSETPTAAVKVAGLTYSLGLALALVPENTGTPVVLPTLPIGV